MNLIRILLYAFSVSAMLSCNSSDQTHQEPNTLQLDQLPEIGEMLDDSLVFRGTKDQLLTSSSQTNKFTQVYVNKVLYTVAWKGAGTCAYLSTADPNFMTQEGLSLNSKVESIGNYDSLEIRTERGWAFYIPLSNGWNAAFCVDNTCTGKRLQANDKISWFFKR